MDQPMHPDQTITSRRAFLAAGGSAAAISLLARRARSQQEADSGEDKVPVEPQSLDDLRKPSPEPGPRITTKTIAEAEKLAGVEFTDDERAMIAAGVDEDIARFVRRRSVVLTNDDAPAQTFSPRLPGRSYAPQSGPSIFSTPDRSALPDDESIAYAGLAQLAAWIRGRQLTAQKLTRIYLDRLKKHDSQLECVAALMEDAAMQRARAMDVEIAGGNYRGPLHGIPWGAKDLLDTIGVTTGWGATPYKDRRPDRNAVVVDRLEDAGAILIAKLTLGALAYGDIWHGGRTNNPFNLKQGSSGSSAGSAAATVAGLVGFSIGTETLGSIVSPSMRCGATGLRPTFGRVARTGAMALCWSLDKIGPICRRAEDTAMVLDAINGADAGDPSSADTPFGFDAAARFDGIRLGTNNAWFEEAHELDRTALNVIRKLGLPETSVTIPDWPYDQLLTILMVEAASAFEEITLNNTDDQMVWQSPAAWPNAFRMTRFTPGIEYIQAERFRRRCCQMMARIFDDVDIIIAPSFAASLLLITNNTGHPSLTIRTGLREDGTPHGITLIGNLYDEARLCRVGMALEEHLDVWHVRPSL